MPIEFHRDGPWELPKGWVWARLGDVVEIYDGRRVPINAKEREQRTKGKGPEELYPYYGATGQVGFIDGYLFDGEYVLLGEDGAPFLERSRPKSYIACGRFWVNNHAHILSAREVTFNRFLMHYLNYADYTEFVGGTTRLKLTQADLIQIPVPLAPLSEQRRIAARIDELFTEIADGETALARARDDLDTWRRALLKAAVTGELTREWRERNKPNETGRDMLARVAKARNDYNSRKTRSRKLIVEAIDEDSLPEIPDTWAWASLGELGEIVGGITVDKKRRPNDPVTVPYLRVANVQRGRLDLAQVKTISVERGDAKDLSLQPGDILLNEGGDRDKIGRGWVWNGEIKGCIHQNHVFRVRLFDRCLNPYFVSPTKWGDASLWSKESRRQILRRSA